MGSTFQLFDKAEQLELLCADIYRALARQFQGDPEAHDLFQRLEAEERRHPARVRLLAARYQADSKLLEAAAVAAHHLDQLLRAARAGLSRVPPGPPNLALHRGRPPTNALQVNWLARRQVGNPWAGGRCDIDAFGRMGRSRMR